MLAWPMQGALGQAALPASASASATVPSEVAAPIVVGIAAPLQNPWNLTVPTGERFPVQGLIDHSKLGTAGGSVLYPGGHPAIFLGALLVHGLVNSAVQSGKESAEQEKANEILLPYAKVLSESKIEGLVEQLLQSEGLQSKLLLTKSPVEKSRRVVSVPEFFLHPSLHGLILANRVEVYEAGAEKPVTTAVIRLSTHFSDPVATRAQWQSDAGFGLVSASQDLFRKSLRILNRVMLQEGPQQAADEATIKHNHLGERRIERAKVLASQCDRALLRNLRGDLMGVQLWPNNTESGDKPANAAACDVWF
jgi:hypothetical protein